jgi:Protein of unknown function (DUF3563)
MSDFLKLIKALIPSTQSPHERDEAYLAEAVDIYDLERRMREIDARGRHATGDVTFGLGLR